MRLPSIMLTLFAVSASAGTILPVASAGGDCLRHGCKHCTECVPTCTPRYEDKPIKKPVYDLTCSWECVPCREPWHENSCDPEHNPPCADVRIKKKLYKTEIEKVEKKLVYGKPQWVAASTCHACGKHDCCCPRWYDLKTAIGRLFGF